MLPKIIAIVGPTASGKTALANKIAKKFNGEILCVDSRTVYRGMDIGTAKEVAGGGERGKGTGKEDCFFWREQMEQGVQEAQREFSPLPHLPQLSPLIPLQQKRQIELPSLSPSTTPIPSIPPQHGTDLVDPNEEMNGAIFKEYADKVIADISSRGKLPILCGGTGLWMDMIIDNLEMPEVEPDLVLRAELEKRSEDELFTEFAELDPVGAEIIDRKNKRRLIRALEVCKKTGRPFSELRKRGVSKYDTLWIGVDWPRDVLNDRINLRVDEMIKNGLVDEVKSLKEKYGCDTYSMSGIGYREICRYLNGELSLDTAIDEIKNNTRHYAKRQGTWFKRNKNINWVTDDAIAEKLVLEWLEK